jgi:phage minor structural protein
MITLYNSDAITKICTLDNCLECLVTEEENGVFELELTYSIASNNFNDIQSNKVIKAKASDELGEQLFRIYYVSNEINGKIYVKAQHITYDLMDNFVENVTCTKSTCEQSFQAMLSKCQYAHNFKGYSDIEHTATYNLSRVNALEAILGTRGSLLDTYGNGAKLKRDNYNIYLNKTRGNNNGVTIAYSKNITGYKREIDETDLVTCIYPFAKIQKELGEDENTTTVEEIIVLPERFVNSKYINNYPHPKILAVDYSEKEIKDIDSLRTQANKYFSETQKDIPNVNYKVEFIYLHQTAEYEDNNLKALELVGMGDTVTVIDERIGMNVEANVIKTVFNVLTDRYESIELGRFKGSINDIIGDLENNVDNVLNQVNNMYVNFEILDDKIVSEVSKLEGDIKVNSTLIEQTDSYIQSVATDLNGKYTEIKQTVDGIDVTGKVSFSDLSTDGGTTIHGGNIEANTLSINSLSSNNANPIIKLFDNCSIDATAKNEQGKGNAIRLKMDNENYIKVTQSAYGVNGEYFGAHTAIFSSLYPNHEVMIFQGNQHWGKIWTTQGIISTHGNNVYYGKNGDTTDARLAKATEVDSVSTTANNALSKADSAYNKAVSAYNVGNHPHPYLPTSSSSFFESGSHDPLSKDKYNLGWSSKRWQQVVSKDVYATNTYALAIDNPVATISDDTLGDVLDDVIIESPNVMRMSDDNGMNEKLVINVNALKENKNAHLFVGKDDGGKTVVNESSLLALALLEIQKLKQEIKTMKEGV